MRPETVCAALEASTLSRFGIRLPAEKPQTSQTNPFQLESGKSVSLHSAGCTFGDPKNDNRLLNLTVFTAPDAKVHAAVVREFHETDPNEPKPAERIEWRDGHCTLDREPALDPKKPKLSELKSFFDSVVARF